MFSTLRSFSIVVGFLIASGTSSSLAAQHMSTPSVEHPSFSSPLMAKTTGGIPARIANQLELAFPLAVKKVTGVRSCKALFEELGTSGSALLAATTYRRPTQREETWPRIRSAKAFTQVGSSQTVLCDGFAEVTFRAAAATLIHEALHFAGLGELGVDPNAISAYEIDLMVARACNL